MKRRQHEATREIPFDLVIEILSRLPAKSLMRFKSVSKHWLSFIISQYFTKRFRRVSSSTPRLYMGLTFFDNSHLKKVLLSASASYDSDITISSFEADQDLTFPGIRGYISQVFGGLMCIVDGQTAHIYNTTTRQHVVLPDIEESNIIAEEHKLKKIVYYIGHDPVHDRYKVFSTVFRCGDRDGEYISEQWVILLGGDGSSRWRKIPYQSSHFPLTQGWTICGRVHYLAWSRSDDYVLVSFDTISEEISMLQPPEHNLNPGKVDLIEYGGRLAILHYPYLEIVGMMKLWFMEDPEKNTWSSKTLVLHSSEIDIVNKIDLRVQGTTRKGEVIFVPQDKINSEVSLEEPQNTAYFCIFLYDLQKNHMRKVEIRDTPNRYLTKFCDVDGFDDVENIMYL